MISVQFEGGAGVVVGFDIVAGQAGERNSATRRATGVALAGIVRLLADVG